MARPDQDTPPPPHAFDVSHIFLRRLQEAESPGRLECDAEAALRGFTGDEGVPSGRDTATSEVSTRGLGVGQDSGPLAALGYLGGTAGGQRADWLFGSPSYILLHDPQL